MTVKISWKQQKKFKILTLRRGGEEEFITWQSFTSNMTAIWQQ
jgi:hypothetical protein